MSYDDPYGDSLGAPGRPARGNAPQQRSGGGGNQQSQKPNLDGYTEVKVRIQEFYAKYPTGAITTTKIKVIPIDEIDGAARVMVQAKAWRTPDDPHPGIGTSWMEVPGKTPFTKGSEVENCETSAWGRAIAAVGIAIDKGIASAQEIRNARGEDSEPPSISGAAQLAEAAARAAGATDPEPTGTQTPPAAEQPAPVKEEATGETTSPAIEAAQAAADAGGGPAEVIEAAMEATETVNVTTETAVEPEAATKPAPKSKAKGKGPVSDPEAQAAEPPVQSGLTYEEFIRLAREKFLPNGHIAAVAREMVEAKQLPQVGGVRELTDDQRFALLMGAIARKDD